MIRGREGWKIVGFVIAFMLFGRLRSLADQTGIPIRFRYPIQLDHWLFAGHDPVVWLQHRLGQPDHLDLLDFLLVGVYVSYFIVPPAIAFLLWWLRSRDFVPYCLAIILTLYTGLAINFLVPTAPPWLAAKEGYLPPLTRLVAEVLNSIIHGIFNTGNSVAGPNDVAAMPSLHLAVTCIVAFVIARRVRHGVWIGAGYILAMGFALVYLGEHYVSDLVAGLAIAALCWWIVQRLLLRRATRVGADETPRTVPRTTFRD